jgi:hypothetical protein
MIASGMDRLLGLWALLGQTAAGDSGAAAVADLKEITAEGRVSFQPYIFWAYALACILLFAFSAWSIGQASKLGERLEYLERRAGAPAPEKPRA